MKGPSAISILFPILAMGLPISDTSMAIFRRWVRNLPLSAADRRHVHHLLIGLGLNPRQAALLLYSFSGFLCGTVLLGVALRSEFLALVLGISGCLAFLVVVTSRRDELTNLRGDLQARMTRGRQERQAAKLTWEGIQRIELCDSATAAFEIVERTAQHLGCGLLQVSCTSASSPLRPIARSEVQDLAGSGSEMSGPGAVFRFSSGEGLWITVRVELGRDPDLASDIVFRYLERLSQALAGRLEWFQSAESDMSESWIPTSGTNLVEPLIIVSPASRRALHWVTGVISRILGVKLHMERPHREVTTTRLPVVESVTAPTNLARR
jgi:UDP-GlcNAc:undecaprenyl-phosphate GlcNAc-1-phosphate transferase